ncbi:MAG: hypothetical protein U5R06_17375 [candidate division KSB1 bacterium]|nr:hypothetical protein [candidate division KSB1 bacterium]
MVDEPAQLRIVETLNLAPNEERRVSYNQEFPIQVSVINQGTETVRDVTVRLNSNVQELATVNNSPQLIESEIAAGDTGRVLFSASAGEMTGTVNFTSSILSATGLNKSGDPNIVNPGDANSAYAIVERGAMLAIVDVFHQVESINAGDKWSPWNIYAVVSNTGTAPLEFVNITSDNITFTVEEQPDPEYRVTPPESLQVHPDFTLDAGESDTLVYRVTRNGDVAGQAVYQVVLSAFDRQAGPEHVLPPVSASDSVFVNSEALVQIIEARVVANRHNNSGIGLVNRGQEFKVEIDLRTGQLLGVDSVAVRLESDGLSLTNPDTVVIDSIQRDSRATAEFTMVADSSWDVQQGEITEQFEASIISAMTANSTIPAQIRSSNTPSDRMTQCLIQTPAGIRQNVFLGLGEWESVVIGQDFDVITRIYNQGKSKAGEGRIRISPPEDYLVKNPNDTTEYVTTPVSQLFSFADSHDSTDVRFTFRAPEVASGPDYITTTMTQIPVDLNTLDTSRVVNITDTLALSTEGAALSLDNLLISAPDGATDGIVSTEQLFRVRVRVNSTDNILDRRAVLLLPSLDGDAHYELRTKDTLNVHSSEQVVEWTLLAPDVPISQFHEIIVQVEGRSADGRTIKQTNTVSINRVVSRSTLTVEPLEVSWPPISMREGEAYFATDQRAVIRTRVNNSGEAGITGTGTLKLNVLKSGLTILTSDSVQFSDDGYVEWEVRAPTIQKPIGELIRVEMTRLPNDENSGKAVNVAVRKRELTVHTERAAQLQVRNFLINTGHNTVSTQQEFTVSAELWGQNVENNEITAEFHVSNSAYSLSGRSQVVTLVNETASLQWNLQAPDYATTEWDSMWVEITAWDKNSGQEITATSTHLKIMTHQAASFMIEPFISKPEGLTSLVSTEQEFTLSAKITHDGASYLRSDVFKIQLILPQDGDYELLSDFRQQVTGQEINNEIYPEWQIKAPPEKPINLSKFVFIVETVPKDLNTGEQAIVEDKDVEFTIQAVSRADIRVQAYLHQRPGLDTANVRFGNSFWITAKLENYGEAGFHGRFKARLDLPEAYQLLSDSLIKTGERDSVIWQVKAPEQYTNPVDTLRVVLVEPPRDDLSKVAAYVGDSSATVLTRVEKGVVQVDNVAVPRKSGVLTEAVDVPLLGLAFWNKDGGSGIHSILNGVSLTLRNKEGSELRTPGAVFSRIAAVKQDSQNLLCWVK